jgi:hypothetical protein
VYEQNYILIPRVTFFREKWFNSFPEVDMFSPTRTAFKKISFHRIHIENLSTSSEVHNVYNEYQNAFKSVLDKHAPVKNRQPRKNLYIKTFIFLIC